jgi:type I restriction enzyme S subunit
MSWNKVKIGDFLTRIKEPVRIKDQDNYALVTIRMYHKGVTKRADVKGYFIKSSTLYSIKGNQFILSGIDARNGAFGIVPQELNGAVITNDFWTHEINSKLISLDYFYWFTTTPQFYDACIRASEGTTNRQRLQADKFYSFDVWLPSISEQKEWVKKIAELNKKIGVLNNELSNQQTYLQQLRQSILQEAVQGKLTQQNPTDEPTSKLLERIKAEKQELIAAGKLKKEKELPPITEDEIPFQLPKGWVWCRLSDITNLITKGSSPKWQGVDYIEEGLLFITSENVHSYVLDLTKKKFVEWKFNEIEPRSILKKGD